jgi:hypothetical protein
LGVENLLRINLDLSQKPLSFAKQAHDRLPDSVIGFGKTTGFVVNYSYEKAVMFNREGRPIKNLDEAVRPGTAALFVRHNLLVRQIYPKP